MTPSASPVISDVEQWNDEFAREYDIDEYYARSGFLIRWIERIRLRCIRELLDARPDDRVLEVGCGGGHVLRMFPQCNLTGVDVSGEMLAKARRNLDGYPVRLLKGELAALDLPEHSFDRIICTEVLEHVVDPDALLAEMRRLLAPDGRIVVTFPNDAVVNRIKALIRATGLTILPPFRRISWGGDQYHLHVWRVGEMRELLARCFNVAGVRFAPSRVLPVRCCFACTGIA
ncbi:MAG: class I SAM-dependent methyltransferase [Phycisphaerales bacterium]|nr:class I SAM-dependent methyltransferase [Phycisphaerales bacterium]